MTNRAFFYRFSGLTGFCEPNKAVQTGPIFLAVRPPINFLVLKRKSILTQIDDFRLGISL